MGNSAYGLNKAYVWRTPLHLLLCLKLDTGPVLLPICPLHSALLNRLVSSKTP